MAGEAENFVLNYAVETKDSEAKLEKLDAKVKVIRKDSKDAQKGFEDFAKGASEEVGKLIPGVEKVSSAVRLMTSEFTVAAVAVAALGAGVKAVIDLREQYGQQRVSGMATGVSGVRMEEYQRKFAKNSDGNVSREMADEQIRSLAEKAQSAYADPTRMGNEAKMFKLLGVDVGKRGSPMKSFNEIFTQLATNFSKMKPEMVQGQAQALGINPDFAKTLAKLGDSVGKVTEMTEEEINKRSDAEASLVKFNDQMAKFKESVNELEISLGQKLLPAFTKLIEIVDKIVKLIPDAAETTSKQVFGTEKPTPLQMGKLLTNPLGSIFDRAKEAVMKKVRGDKTDAEAHPEEKSVSTGVVDRTNAKTEVKKSNEDRVNALDRINQESIQNSANMRQAINMFVGAVATFASAIDEKQAWASWAGVVGKAAGLGAPETSNPVSGAAATGAPPYDMSPKAGASIVGKTSFDKEFEENAKRTGVPVHILKAIAQKESSMNPNAKGALLDNGDQAEGLMQVLRSNKKSLGVNDLMDPAQNIKAGSTLFAQYLKDTGGDLEQALMMYHGGPNRKIWGPKTRAYAKGIMGNLGEGTGGAKVVGESRDKLQLSMVQENIARRLNIPSDQLRQGAINKGDVSWAANQLDTGIQNQIQSLKIESTKVGLPEQSKAKILNDIRQQESGLAMLRQYAPQVVSGAREGERSLTIGENAIIININGVIDPNKTGEIVEGHLQNHIGDIINNSATGIKY